MNTHKITLEKIFVSIIILFLTLLIVTNPAYALFDLNIPGWATVLCIVLIIGAGIYVIMYFFGEPLKALAEYLTQKIKNK